ncbi:dynamin family protein [Acetobacterium sp. UBA5834]|jgi:GTPase SAR1 family protein|uniref:dynamin family protein n=1 Tax=Acetobacterium sp. UBA5834 TaxID=1945907 RepID=UPI00257DD63C|nr:dynamin family protein [Acetobacterium sp. UBA5834]
MIVKISYNPYVKKSQIAYNGNEIENDSIFKYIYNKKIQNWFEVTSEWQGIFAELKQKFGDERLYLEFWGRMIDYKELEINFQKYQSDQVLLSAPVLIEDENIVMNEISSFINKLEQNDTISCELSDEFEKINSNKFKICVIATMSSGKSTLINAMLGRDLLPSNTAACTATITTLTDNDEMEVFDVRCFDQTGKLYIEKRDVTLEELESYNENEEIKIIDLEGPIPGITTSRFNLHLIDTPGPNNSTNDDHEKLTFEMIESDDYAMVIYVMSPETIQSDDNDELLQMIAETMKKAGKKADERFLFVINKCDNLDPEDEDDTIESVLETAKAYLKKRGIDKPNIYPVTAEIAKLIRMNQRGEKLTRKDRNEIDDWLEIFDNSKPEDKEYQRLKSFEEFSSVTPQVRQTLAKRLKTAKTEKNVVAEGLIHTGVPVLEESIEQYLAKLVYPAKINEFITCVDTYLKFPILAEAIAHYFDEKLKLVKHGNEVFKRVQYVLEKGSDHYKEETGQISSDEKTKYMQKKDFTDEDNVCFDYSKITECLVVRMINSDGLIVINNDYCNVNPIGINNLKLMEMRDKGKKYFGSEGFKYKILKESELKNFDKKDLSRIIWMPKNLKKEIQNQLNPTVALNEKIEDFCQMVSDEIVAKDAETLLIFAQKQNHPIFQ